MKKLLRIILGIVLSLAGAVFVYWGLYRQAHGATPFEWLSYVVQGFIGIVGGILVALGAGVSGFLRRLF